MITEPDRTAEALTQLRKAARDSAELMLRLGGQEVKIVPADLLADMAALAEEQLSHRLSLWCDDCRDSVPGLCPVHEADFDQLAEIRTYLHEVHMA